MESKSEVIHFILKCKGVDPARAEVYARAFRSLKKLDMRTLGHIEASYRKQAREDAIRALSLSEPRDARRPPLD